MGMDTEGTVGARMVEALVENDKFRDTVNGALPGAVEVGVGMVKGPLAARGARLAASAAVEQAPKITASIPAAVLVGVVQGAVGVAALVGLPLYGLYKGVKKVAEVIDDALP